MVNRDARFSQMDHPMAVIRLKGLQTYVQFFKLNKSKNKKHHTFSLLQSAEILNVFQQEFRKATIIEYL